MIVVDSPNRLENSTHIFDQRYASLKAYQVHYDETESTESAVET